MYSRLLFKFTRSSLGRVSASCAPHPVGGAEPWPQVHPGVLRGMRAAAGL
jgi:hypothetical protein